jgi:NAD(P)-dependent dehydrogenase (short-subunit alcohol dehydrogenase family)
MEIHERTVVVTGAGSGIGRALAQAFAAAGARVVAGDIDAAAAEATVAGIDAVAVRADASTTAGVQTMLNAAHDAFGPADVFVANAGVVGAPDLGTEEQWDRILDINLRSHIRAASLLMPQWVERGEGHFVTVASAAGLLTQLGAAGYAVTKHAAVGLAEWLSITYGDNGIGVTCVCPMGVNTPLLDGMRTTTNPDELLAAQSVVNAGTVVEPEQVAAMTLDAVRDGGFLVLPHPEVLEMYRQKGADYDRWLAGMRRYRRALTD